MHPLSCLKCWILDKKIVHYCPISENVIVKLYYEKAISWLLFFCKHLLQLSDLQLCGEAQIEGTEFKDEVPVDLYKVISELSEHKPKHVQKSSSPRARRRSFPKPIPASRIPTRRVTSRNNR